MLPIIHISLPSYAVMAFIGASAALMVLFSRSNKRGILFTDFLKIVVFSILGIIIGSKLLFAITRIPWLIENFSIVNLILLIPDSGFVYYGGLLGMLGAIWFIYRKKSEERHDVFNMLAPIIPLFHGFGRIGCFMSGCCYGKDLSTPIHIVGDVYLTQIPVQLIESLFEFILFAVILALEKKATGISLLTVYLLCYAVFRYIIEFFRGDTIRGLFFGLSTSQWVSVFILIGIITLIMRQKIIRHRNTDNMAI